MRTDPDYDNCFYKIGWVILTLTAVCLIGLHFGVIPHLTLSRCQFHCLTGLYCPGCGGSRALIALFHGQLLLSLYYHPIIVYAAGCGGWFMLSQTIQRLSRGRIPIGMHYRDLYLWIALIIVLANWIIKNLVLLLCGIALLS